MTPDYPYQHTGFYFAVTFTGLGVRNIRDADARFQGVSGLEAQIDAETIKEGGENRFVHNLPGRRTYSPLVLKRGVIAPDAGSVLTDWCQEWLRNPESRDARPIDLEIALLGESEGNGPPPTLFMWKIVHAWPKSWKFAELNAERSEILIETLELSYNRFDYVT